MALEPITQVHFSLLEYAPCPSPMAPCVANGEGVQSQLPLQAKLEVTVDAMSAPEVHSHCVIYELRAGDTEFMGHSWQGRFIAGFHWLVKHDDNGSGGGGGGGGGGVGCSGAGQL